MGKVFFKRDHDRSNVEMWVVVTTAEGRHIDGMTGDVGMGGCALSCLDPLPVGTHCDVLLRFGSGDGAVNIQTPGTVVWARESLIGIAFDDIDPDNERKLHDLFLYNPDGE